MEIEENEWQKNMRSLILSIEATIGDHLSKGHTPAVLITTDSTVRQLEDYLKITIDWSTKPVMLTFGDGSIELQLIRGNDLNKGQLLVR